ncbi:MAG: tetratricopeptide repeat protein [Deltaproteobacteria bacterium]|nr:tetratricopeptide repeat protein [Deltaproteobacteria bacterium]
MTLQRQDRLHPWAFLGTCLVAGLTILSVYANSLDNSFHFDDSHVISDNLYIRSLANLPAFFTDGSTFSSLPANATYRPLVSTSLAFDYWLGGGLAPRQFHISQLLLLLVLSGQLFFLFLKIIDQTASRWWNRYVALFAALWFAIHTSNTQTVNYISARSELLSAIGLVGAFQIYLYLPRWRRTYLYLLPMALGALAKSPAVIFAPLLAVYLLLFDQQLSAADLFTPKSWRRVWDAVRASLPALVIGAVLFRFVESMNAAGATYGGGDRLSYLLTQTFVWLHYVRMFFLPLGLTADTDMTLFSTWYDTRVAAGVLCIAVLLRWLWKASLTAESRPVAFGLAWFFLGLLPASSIFPLAEVSNDHRAFLAYIGFTLAVVWQTVLILTRWHETRPWLRPFVLPAVYVLAVLVLGGHASGTYLRNEVWLSEEALWADVAEKSPNNGRGLMNYGLTKMARGHYTEAKALFDRASVFTPYYPNLETNLGVVTDKLNDPVAAERHFKRALQLQPDYVGGQYFYARWLVEQGRAREAIPMLQRAITLSPALPTSRTLLMNLYAAQGADAELRQLVHDTLAITPTDVTALAYANGKPSLPLADADADAGRYYRQAVIFTNQERHLDAALLYRHALKLDPQSADTCNNLGWSLAKLGLYREAVPMLERALSLRPDFDLAQSNLAWVQTQIAAGE